MFFQGSGGSRAPFSEPQIAPKTSWKPRPRRSTFRDAKHRFPSALGGPPGAKKSLGTPKGSWGEISNQVSSNIKPGYHGTGSAFEARAASKASETRARRSQRTLQAETAKKHQEEQKPPRAGQQEHRDSEPGHATEASRRRCAPPPRRLELGAFPRVFLRFSRGFPARSRRSLGKITGRSDTRRPKKPTQAKKNSSENSPPTQP